jgi:hypothetical protein
MDMEADQTPADDAKGHLDMGRARYSTAAGDTPVAVGDAEGGTAGAPGYNAVTAGATDFADDAEGAREQRDAPEGHPGR